jgi:hypothetical protein
MHVFRMQRFGLIGVYEDGARIWLRRHATSRKVAGWSPDGVTGIFH